MVDEILERVCSLLPLRLEDYGVSKELSDIISKMMNKEPYKRYRTTDKLICDINKLKEK